MGMLLGPTDVQIWARPQSRGPNGILVDNIISARFYRGKYGWGGGEIRARLSSGWLAAAAALGTGPLDVNDVTSWSRWTWDLYVRNFDESTSRAALWTGPATTRVIRHAGDPSSAEIVFTLEDIIAHGLRKRSLYISAGFAVQSSNAAADTVANSWITGCYGSGGGTGIITPPNYPTTRHNTSPWAFQSTSVAGTAPTIYLDFQPGQPLIRGMETLCELAGLYTFTTEATIADSPFKLSVGYPYQRSDLSTKVILSPRLGTARAFENEQTVRDLLTVIRARGDGAGDAQAYSWGFSSAGQTVWGNVEGEATFPGRTTTGAASEATKLVNRLAEGGESVSLSVSETVGRKFVTDWNWRDLVTYFDDVTGLTAALLVTGWEIAYNETDGWSLDVTLGDPRATIEQQLARENGYLGTALAGGWTKQADG